MAAVTVYGVIDIAGPGPVLRVGIAPRMAGQTRENLKVCRICMAVRTNVISHAHWKIRMVKRALVE
jgi:hypothetical protein